MTIFKDIAERCPAPEETLPCTVTPFPKCDRCRTFNVANAGDWCEQCTREHEQGYEVLSMLGRLANGAELDHGTRYHAVQFSERTALCGAEPGRRSVGWTFDPTGHGKEVTCPRCLRKLEKMETK